MVSAGDGEDDALADSGYGRTANSAAGDLSGTVIQVGSVDGGVHVGRFARTQVELPYRSGIVPLRAVAFQPRPTAIELASVMRSHAAQAQDEVRTIVLSGLGGVGKTQIARDYVERVWESGGIDLVVWITAGSREAIVSSYARLAADLTGVEDSDVESGARRALEWLARTPARWLVVLDDVQSPAHLRGLWPPDTPTGRVVLTTRRRDAALRGHRRRIIDVGPFLPAEAAAYLESALADRTLLLDGAEEVADALGNLPLALAQAAAYMLDRGLSCRGFLDRLTDRSTGLAALAQETEGLPDDHRSAVVATWSLSLEQANQLHPTGLAGPLLEAASMLDANSIPVEVFTTTAVVEFLRGVSGRRTRSEDARDGLGCLHRLSLITLDLRRDTQTASVHALVQRVTRDSMSTARSAAVCRVVADALAQLWPAVERDTARVQVLRTNAIALVATGGEALWLPEGHPLLFRLGKSLGAAGLVVQARDYYARLLSAAEDHLGPNHPNTLRVRHNLAVWTGEAGNPGSAVQQLMAVLSDRRRVLGAKHPDALITQDLLARWQGRAGTASHDTNSREHPRYLSDDLATWRAHAGDPAATIEALQEVLTERLRVLGPNHTDTLATRVVLGSWRGDAGDARGAVSALTEVLSDYVRLLGPDHPDTLNCRSNLIRWRGHAGDPAGAAEASADLLVDRLRVLGPDHPSTLATRAYIAYWTGQAGDPGSAVTAMKDVLRVRTLVLGPDHPDTLATANNLGYWLAQAGDPAAAVACLQNVLDNRQRVLGPNHPDTLITRLSLRQWTQSTT